MYPIILSLIVGLSNIIQLHEIFVGVGVGLVVGLVVGTGVKQLIASIFEHPNESITTTISWFATVSTLGTLTVIGAVTISEATKKQLV
jgi:hypothetical protein